MNTQSHIFGILLCVLSFSSCDNKESPQEQNTVKNSPPLKLTISAENSRNLIFPWDYSIPIKFSIQNNSTDSIEIVDIRENIQSIYFHAKNPSNSKIYQWIPCPPKNQSNKMMGLKPGEKLETVLKVEAHPPGIFELKAFFVFKKYRTRELIESDSILINIEAGK